MGQKWFQWIADNFPLFRWTFFLNFKGPWPFKIKTSDFSVLMYFIVAWTVNVAVTTNFHGSGAQQDATTTVIAIVLFVILMTFYLVEDRDKYAKMKIREKSFSAAREILRKPANISQPCVQ
jgi:hypothetical protein